MAQHGKSRAGSRYRAGIWARDAAQGVVVKIAENVAVSAGSEGERGRPPPSRDGFSNP
jgi:hypothetical protein